MTDRTELDCSCQLQLSWIAFHLTPPSSLCLHRHQRHTISPSIYHIHTSDLAVIHCCTTGITTRCRLLQSEPSKRDRGSFPSFNTTHPLITLDTPSITVAHAHD